MKQNSDISHAGGLAPRIAAELRRRIASGMYRSGGFPSAQALLADDDLIRVVGPITLQPARTALAMLVGEGLLSPAANRRLGFVVQRKRHELIALLAYTATGDFVGRLLDGINSGLREKLCVVATLEHRQLNADAVTRAEDELIAQLATRTDGLILLPSGRIDRMPHLRRLIDTGFPIVFLGPGLQPPGFQPLSGTHRVVYSEQAGARTLCGFVETIVERERLHEDGLVAIVGEISNATLFQRANEINRFLCLSNQMPRPRLVLSPMIRGEAGVDAIGQLAATATLPRGKTLIIATTDLAALGAIKALKERDYSVPADAMVIGVDDDEFAQYLDLTTLKHDPRTVGRVAVRLLQDLIDGRGELLVEILVEEGHGEIQKRGSTRH